MADHNKLDDFLNNNTPEPDENARKLALNSALGEFDKHQKEKNEKKLQGFGWWARLTGNINPKDRSSFMKRKYIYGGMATAMVVVLASGAALYQTQNHELVRSQTDMATTPSVSKPPATTEEMRAPIREYNEEGIQESATSQDSFIPVPVGPPTSTGIEIQENETSQNAPLERWRVLQEQRAPQQKSMETPASPQPQAQSELAVTSNPNDPFAKYREQLDQLEKQDRDQFEDHEISSVKQVTQEPVSTFSADVDTASYSYVRRQLEAGQMPDPNAVRIEEMINYFPYDYQGPESKDTPFNANVAVAPSPWKEGNKLIHIGIKGYDIEPDVQPRSNLVFLLDVSGSMNHPDKLPLLKNSFKMLLNKLHPDDTVGIVVYAGQAGTVLEPTKVAEKDKIINALEKLQAGGSTAGAAGIEGAYTLAEQNLDEEAVNRVILATDGDFNVGMSSNDELKELIEKKRDSGIFLSVLGFGQGNLNDHMMQTLAQNGNGIAAHIDNLNEARKVLVDEATSTLFPIAKDVKIQVEFNPETVAEYRLIGYETRALAREDFNNDKVDAGDIGAGHTVTAIYEIVPEGSDNALYDESRYVDVEDTASNTDFGGEYAFLKMRYKLPDEDTSKLITTPISKSDEVDNIRHPTPQETKFSIAVAGFGQLLKNDKYLGQDFDYQDVLELAQQGKGDDPYGYRAEFLNLVRLAQSLDQE